MKIEYRHVLVKWHDSKGVTETWQFMKDLPEPIDSIMYSSGFVLQDTDEVMVIAPHISIDEESSQYCGDMQIPHAAILEIWDIK